MYNNSMQSIDWNTAEAFGRLVHCNPFLPERIECERQVLGDDFVAADAVWNISHTMRGTRPNIGALQERAERLASLIRAQLASGEAFAPSRLRAYEDLCLYVLYYRYHDRTKSMLESSADATRPIEFFRDFQRDLLHFFQIDGKRGAVSLAVQRDAAHVFALLYQIRRAFFHVFNFVVGGSMAAAKLRADIWQSTFTHDMRRYQRTLFSRMGDFTTLITGASGTGKEIVARAIALSRYIPFDARSRSFKENYTDLFHPLNLSALSPTLIESELFGHRRGAFTGALADRRGWLETCKPLGTVFLDEIGELDPQIQVKMLRVLQERTFQRLGDTQDRHFSGKIIAATHRNLALEMKQGSFRADFYYRLCSDIIVTPTLREQLSESPAELRNLVLFIALRFAGDEAESVSDEVVEWIGRNLGRDYAWPGNFRELEQCVRNVLIRREYLPPRAPAGDIQDDWIDSILAGRLTADELLNSYCRRVHSETGNYVETARRVRLDRRTVKARVESR